MNIFCTDLDNTIIYSYKHDIDKNKINVEKYQGREISFASEYTLSLLKQVREEMMIIPTSTRTEQQYNRIDLKIGQIEYALVCNGGVLLINGARDEEWYQESLLLIEESKTELKRAIKLLETDVRREFELRFIDDLFVFTKCDYPKEVVEDLKRSLDTEYVKIFNNGVKVYVVPSNLSKGTAIKRLRNRFNPKYIIAAGDSEFDVSMVEEADYGLVPAGFVKTFGVNKKVFETEEGMLFSDELLKKCLKINAELK